MQDVNSTVEEKKVFGMKRINFRGAAIGVAIGWFASAGAGIAGIPWMSDYGSCILFGAIGYGITKMVVKKLNK